MYCDDMLAVGEAISEGFKKMRKELLSKREGIDETSSHMTLLEAPIDLIISYFKPLGIVKSIVVPFIKADAEETKKRYENFKKLDKKISGKFAKHAGKKEKDSRRIIGKVKDKLDDQLIKWKRDSQLVTKNIEAAVAFLDELENQAEKKFDNEELIKRLKKRMLEDFSKFEKDYIARKKVLEKRSDAEEAGYFDAIIDAVSNSIDGYTGSSERAKKKDKLMKKFKKRGSGLSEKEDFFNILGEYSKKADKVIKQDFEYRSKFMGVNIMSDAALFFTYLNTLKAITDRVIKNCALEKSLKENVEKGIEKKAEKKGSPSWQNKKMNGRDMAEVDDEPEGTPNKIKPKL